MSRKAPFPHAGSYWHGTPGVRRRVRPLLTSATNDTLRATTATVRVVPSGTTHAILSEQEPNHSSKDVYLPHCRTQAHRVSTPQCRTTWRSAREATGGNNSESTTPGHPCGHQQLHNNPWLFTTSADRRPTWGRMSDTVAQLCILCIPFYPSPLRL
jgi:hypothetical protein